MRARARSVFEEFTGAFGLRTIAMVLVLAFEHPLFFLTTTTVSTSFIGFPLVANTRTVQRPHSFGNGSSRNGFGYASRMADLKRQLPNALTLMRGALTLAIALCFFIPFPDRYILAYALFLVAAMSDYVDGVLARRWHVTSDFGAIFDPLFDKILVLSLFILVAPFMIVHPAILVVLLVRDITTDAMRNFQLAKGAVVPAVYSAKWKTVMQLVMLNFILLAIAIPGTAAIAVAAQISGVIAAVLSLWSGAIYTNRFIAFTRANTASSTT